MPTARPHRTLISGVTGHIGRELTSQLVAGGIEVHGLTRQEISSVPPWSAPATRHRVALGSLALHRIDGRTETLIRLFQELRPQTVIHLAALARRDHLPTDIVPFVEANILYGAQLLEAMRLSDCRHIVVAESILQYSDTGEYHPLNLYAATKKAFADLLSYYADAFDLSAIALILPTIYSEYEAVPKLMTDITSALRTGTGFTLQTQGVLIDLVHVDDVAGAFLRASELLEDDTMQKPMSVSRYCVSSGRDIAPTELIALFEKVGKKKILVRKEPPRTTSRRGNPWRGPLLPGWVPKVDIEAGIERMLFEKR